MQIGAEWKMGRSRRGQNTFCFLHLEVQSACISTQPRLRQSKERHVHQARGRRAPLPGSLGHRAFPSVTLVARNKGSFLPPPLRCLPVTCFQTRFAPHFAISLSLALIPRFFGFCSGPLRCTCGLGLLK